MGSMLSTLAYDVSHLNDFCLPPEVCEVMALWREHRLCARLLTHNMYITASLLTRLDGLLFVSAAPSAALTS